MNISKKVRFLAIVFAVLVVLAVPVGAVSNYSTYTYSYDSKYLESPDAYTASEYVSSLSIGLDTSILDPKDLFVDENNQVYLSDTGNNRVIVLDSYYNLRYIINTFVNEEGVPDSLTGPQGLFVKDDVLYVCDTQANRIVKFDTANEGAFIGVVQEPKDSSFEEGSLYRPVAVAVDDFGRLFVVSSSTYQGVIVMREDGSFTGFVGAQAVTMDLFTRIWRMFQTEEQRAKTESYISVEYNNIDITEEGFIYVTSSAIEAGSVQSYVNGSKGANKDYAPAKLINTNGDEIMKRNGLWNPGGELNFLEPMESINGATSGVSILSDIAAGPEKTWSIVDQNRSKIFTYDDQGNLLFAFGDKGTLLGNASLPSAITYQGDKMLVLDFTNAAFTVYERTEYGDILMNAVRARNERDYDSAYDRWMDVLQRNTNMDIAYVSVGDALYSEGYYEEALEYYETAYNTENWSDAFKEIRKQWIAKYALTIPLIIVAVCVAWMFFMRYCNKVNSKITRKRRRRSFKEELLYAFHVIFHPFDGFWDLKHEGRGSVRASLIIMLATVCAFYYQAAGNGYVLNPYGNTSSIITQFLAVLLPVLLWIVSNWCLTTLFDGEGSFKDVFVATGYALTPMILVLIPSTLLSNIILAEEAAILNLLVVLGYIWAGILLFTGMMITHDYSMFKSVVTALGTIIGMAIVMFIAVLFGTLVGKIISFVMNIVTEIGYRM